MQKKEIHYLNKNFQQFDISKGIKAQLFQSQISFNAILDVNLIIQCADDLLNLAKVDLNRIQQTIFKNVDTKEKRIVFLLFVKRSQNKFGKILEKGIRQIVDIFAMKNIYTKTDLITFLYKDDNPNAFIQKFFKFFQIQKLAAVLHGSILQINSQKQKIKSQGSYTLITGGTRGIGKQISTKMAKMGKNIIVTSRGLSNYVLEFTQKLKNDYKVQVIPLALDLSSSQSCIQLGKDIYQTNIKLQALIHNGAVGTKTCIQQSIGCTPQETLLKVNTIGPINLHQALVEKGILQKSCKITVISSVMAVRGFSQMNEIDIASKGMLQPWIQQNSKQGWNVSVIYPGATDTEMFQQSTTNKLKQINCLDEFVNKLPKNFIIHPSLIAQVVLLAQDKIYQTKNQPCRFMASCGMFLDFVKLPSVTPKEQKQSENKQKQDFKDKQLLSMFNAHFHSVKNHYQPVQNPQGFVNYGVSINTNVMKKTLQYLPSYIKQNNLHYQAVRGSQKLNQIICKNTSYSIEQTIVIDSILTIVDIFASSKGLVSYQGILQNFENVIDHARAQIVDFNRSQCHFIFQSLDQKSYQQYFSDKYLNSKIFIIVIDNPNKIIYTKNPNIFYVYQIKYPQGYSAGVCHSTNKNELQMLQEYYMMYPLSTLISGTIQYLSQHKKLNQVDTQFLENINKNQNYLSSFHKMIENDANNKIDPENIFFGFGAASCLCNCSLSIFKQGDILTLDSPFYFAFRHDFKRSGVQLNFKQIFKGKLIDRVKSAYQQGSNGYVIVNPHNPTGVVFDPSQITQICQWVKDKRNFNIIFDQMYLNSPVKKQVQIKSAMFYANQFQNIHVIRGFAKDYGMCGFKIGILVSSNQKIKQNYKKWRCFTTPQPFVLKTVGSLLQKTNYGLEIYKHCRNSLIQTTQLTTNLLDKYQISYIKPKGGCFIIINLQKYLQENKLTDQQLWKKIFYVYKVNISLGKYFLMDQPGQFRFCYVVSQQNIKQGLRRLGNMLKNKLPFEK